MTPEYDDYDGEGANVCDDNDENGDNGDVDAHDEDDAGDKGVSCQDYLQTRPAHPPPACCGVLLRRS